MKVAFSSTGKTLDSLMDPRFGRCSWFVIVETEDMSFEAVSNESVALRGGAGIQSAQTLASKGVSAVITGHCGPNAMSALSAAGVEVIIGQARTGRDAVERYKRGELPSASEADVRPHYGMGAGGGMGRSRGKGQGTGVGRGMGGSMGRGMATADAGFSASTNLDPPLRNEDLGLLKSEAQDLIRKLKEIKQRIGNLDRRG